MREVFLGEYIRQRRLDEGLTQAQLCEGICEPVTISRLENGQQTPSRNTINALLQRLGLPDDRYFALISDHEVEIKALKDEILADTIRYRRASEEERPAIRVRALENLTELKNIAEPDDKITQQYILNSMASLGALERPYTFTEQIELLMEAIRLTVPRFELNKISSFRYSMDETRIINQIANTYANAGQEKKAAGIFSQLLKYVEVHDKELTNYAGHLCMISMNYAITLDALGRYDEAIELASKGWKTCVEYGHYQFLGSFIAILAECYFFKGNFSKSIKLYYQACFIYDAVGDKSNLANMRKELKEHLGLEAPV